MYVFDIQYSFTGMDTKIRNCFVSVTILSLNQTVSACGKDSSFVTNLTKYYLVGRTSHITCHTKYYLVNIVS